jgi:hypothetical protein
MSKWPPLSDNSMSKTTVKVVVFHCRFAPGSLWLREPTHTAARGPLWCLVVVALTSHLYYTPHVVAQYQTRVKLNRVFFPR